MGLLKHDNTHWPLALTIAHGEPTLEQHGESLAAWDEWFSHAEPLHVIRVYLDAASLRHASGAAQATQAWMKAGAAEHMRELVQSMLIVVPADQFDSMKKMSVRKAFGIPGALFSSLDDAFAWLDNPPELVKGLPLDKALLDGVRQTVDGITSAYEKSGAYEKLGASETTYSY